MLPYSEFMKTKAIRAVNRGFFSSDLTVPLFDWQKVLLDRACQFGRGALFADCGLGKTPIQIEWSLQALRTAKTKKQVLIFSPLAVAEQTQREGKKFGVNITVCRDQADLKTGINVTNYEMLKHFQPESLQGVVLDESGILKSYSGKTRTELIDFASPIDYRLCCTATPSPNDIMEIGNHAEFLNIMSRSEMLATFFIHDSGDTQKWRLKKHGVNEFYKWLSSWSMAIRGPADIGYHDDRFTLPSLTFEEVKTKANNQAHGFGFVEQSMSLLDRRQARRNSLSDRVKLIADRVNSSKDCWVVWCDLNSESEALVKVIPDAVEVRGSDSIEHKRDSLLSFSSGNSRVIITKPAIAGWGLNWQHCHNMAFTGLSDSYEQFYQAVRRCWRFGQEYPVNVLIVISGDEGAVLRNIQRKEAQAKELYDNLIAQINMESL